MRVLSEMEWELVIAGGHGSCGSCAFPNRRRYGEGARVNTEGRGYDHDVNLSDSVTGGESLVTNSI